MIRLAILILVLLWSSTALAVTTRYASKDGTGAAPCTVNTEGGACTVQRALLEMDPGDTLILRNGTYTSPASMIAISGTYHQNGSSALPITVQAQTDGGVLLNAGNDKRPFQSSSIGYWTFKGFNLCCANDTTVFVGSGSHHLRFERVIAWDQGDPTAGVMTIYQANNITLVDIAAFGHGRKMFAVQGDTNTIVNRALFFKFKTNPAPNNGGVTTTYTYHSRGNKFYNTINGTDLMAPTASNYYQHAIFSNDHYQQDHGITTTLEMHGNITYHVDGQAVGTLQVLATYGMNPAETTIPLDNNITFLSRNNLTMRRNAASPALGHSCSGNGTSVKCNRDSWTDSLGSLATGTHATDGITIAASAAPDLLRLQATTQPADGAWIRYKYTDAGVLTTEELWPWPMKDRLSAAIGGTAYAGRGWDGKGGKDINAIILALAGSSLGASAVLHAAYIDQPQSVQLGATLNGVRACVYNETDVIQLGHAAPMTIALQSNPGAATLGGTLTQTPVSGCATWNNLTVNAAGTGYTLRVTSTGVTQADSTPFNITTVPITIVGDRVRMVP